MAVRRYEDLECWQLANELKKAVYDLIENSPAGGDSRFRAQLKDAAGSGPANLAEAFAYYEHPDSRRFARFAKGSLTETHNHLMDGIDSRYWPERRVAPLLTLARRAIRGDDWLDQIPVDQHGTAALLGKRQEPQAPERTSYPPRKEIPVGARCQVPGARG